MKRGIFVMLIIMMTGFNQSIFAAAGLGVMASNSNHALGVDVSSNSLTIPIKSGGFMIEPFVGYTKFSATDSGGGKTTTETRTMGIGIFGVVPSGDTNTYFGARIAKAKFEVKDQDPFGFRFRDDYLVVTPLIGFESNIVQKMSAAFELGFSVTDGENEGNFNEDVEGTSIYTALILRRVF